MKVNIIAIIFMAVLSFGCSSLLTTYSSNEIVVSLVKVSGDQLEILEDFNANSLNQRIIFDTKNNKSVGYIKILDDLTYENCNKFKLNTSSLEKAEKGFKLNLEVSIDNSFLEKNENEYDQIVVWSGENSFPLFDGVSSNFKDVTETKVDDNATLFNFYVLLSLNLKTIDLSLQTLNVIK